MKALTPAALTMTTGLSAYLALPSSRSVPKHASRPMAALSSRLSANGCSRLRLSLAGSPRVCAESGSYSYGPTVRFRLLPTPPLGDAVAFRYKATTRFGRDFHPADKTHSQTHQGRPRRGRRRRRCASRTLDFDILPRLAPPKKSMEETDLTSPKRPRSRRHAIPCKPSRHASPICPSINPTYCSSVIFSRAASSATASCPTT
jgi:hypothetical protein